MGFWRSPWWVILSEPLQKTLPTKTRPSQEQSRFRGFLIGKFKYAFLSQNVSSKRPAQNKIDDSLLGTVFTLLLTFWL